MFHYIETLNDKIIQKPGYRERLMIEELKKHEEDENDFYISENKLLVQDEDLRISSSSFFNPNGPNKSMKDPLMMSMAKMNFQGTLKEEPKKQDNIIEREQELTVFIDKFCLDLYEIKCKSDTIFKRRFPNGFEENSEEQNSENKIEEDSIKSDDLDYFRNTTKDRLIGTPKKNIIIK